MRNFRRRKRKQGDVGVACQENQLTVCHLNANGLSEESVHDLSYAATIRNVKVICVTETKFRREQNIVHHSIEGFKLFETRRSDAGRDGHQGRY